MRQNEIDHFTYEGEPQPNKIKMYELKERKRTQTKQGRIILIVTIILLIIVNIL